MREDLIVVVNRDADLEEERTGRAGVDLRTLVCISLMTVIVEYGGSHPTGNFMETEGSRSWPRGLEKQDCCFPLMTRSQGTAASFPGASGPGASSFCLEAGGSSAKRWCGVQESGRLQTQCSWPSVVVS